MQEARRGHAPLGIASSWGTVSSRKQISTKAGLCGKKLTGKRKARFSAVSPATCGTPQSEQEVARSAGRLMAGAALPLQETAATSHAPSSDWPRAGLQGPPEPGEGGRKEKREGESCTRLPCPLERPP